MAGKWSKEASLARAGRNQKLQEVMHASPLMHAIIGYAANKQSTVGYDRNTTNATLNAYARILVGWFGCYKEFTDSSYYDAVMMAIEDLLPPDDYEIYRRDEDMPLERREAWALWRQQQVDAEEAKKWEAAYHQREALYAQMKTKPVEQPKLKSLGEEAEDLLEDLFVGEESKGRKQAKRILAGEFPPGFARLTNQEIVLHPLEWCDIQQLENW